VPHEPPWARGNWQSYCVRLPAFAGQRRVMQYMLDRGISTRRGIMCSHLEPTWTGHAWIAGAGGLDISETAQRECILLPLFPGLTEVEQQQVVITLKEAVAAESAAA